LNNYNVKDTRILSRTDMWCWTKWCYRILNTEYDRLHSSTVFCNDENTLYHPTSLDRMKQKWNM